jgi:hypothetical protein
VRLFSTNDYLGLSAHPAVAAAAATAAARYGMGPRASALVAGYTNHVRGLDMPSTVGLESRHLETRAKTAARLDLDVFTGWASSLSLSACRVATLCFSPRPPWAMAAGLQRVAY